MSFKIFLITLAGFAAVLVILSEAAARVRDVLVEHGWISRHGLLGRMAISRRRIATLGVLEEIGFNGDHFKAIRDVMYRQSPKKLSGLPEAQLIDSLRQWIKEIPTGYQRLHVNNKLYIDTMGAMYFAEAYRPPLSKLMADLLIQLEKQDDIQGFDCILGNKDGNTKLVDEVCLLFSQTRNLVPIICKGEKDPARSSQSVNRFDFEGLEAFLQHQQNRAKQSDRDATWKFRVIAVDDNCTSGKTLCSAIARFNRLIEMEKLPFEPIAVAVTLFVVRSADTEDVFRTAGVQLYTLLSLSDIEMRRITRETTKALLKDLEQFKQGYGTVHLKALK